MFWFPVFCIRHPCAIASIVGHGYGWAKYYAIMSNRLICCCSTPTAKLWPGGFSQPFSQTRPGVHYRVDQWRGAASRRHPVTRSRKMYMAAKNTQEHGTLLLHQRNKVRKVQSQHACPYHSASVTSPNHACLSDQRWALWRRKEGRGDVGSILAEAFR